MDVRTQKVIAFGMTVAAEKLRLAVSRSEPLSLTDLTHIADVLDLWAEALKAPSAAGETPCSHEQG
jgi:hypothetical protein